MIGLHLTLTPCRNESRLLKHSQSKINNNICNKIFVIALSDNSKYERERLLNNIEVYRVKRSFLRSPLSVINPIFNFGRFFLTIIRLVLKNKIKILVIHSYILLPLGAILKKLKGCLLVFDAHELETEKNGLLGFKKRVSKIIEKSFIYFVDIIFVVSESIADWYSDEYLINKPTVIFNYPTHAEDLLTKNHNYFRKHFNIKNNEKIFLYQGVLSPGRGIELMINAFSDKDFAIEQNCCLIIMGYGPMKNEVIKAADEYDSIYFHKSVLPKDLASYTSCADIGLSLIESSCLSYEYCMPNKLFEYLHCGIPVMASNRRDMAEFIKNNELGVIIDSESVEGIHNAIKKFEIKEINNSKINISKIKNKLTWESQEHTLIRAYSKKLGPLNDCYS